MHGTQHTKLQQLPEECALMSTDMAHMTTLGKAQPWTPHDSATMSVPAKCSTVFRDSHASGTSNWLAAGNPTFQCFFSNETVEISEDKTNIYKCPETGICSPVASQAIVIQCLVLSLVSALFAHVKQHSAESQNADTDTHTHIYICMYTYIHIYTDICIYTHTSTIKETHK